MNTVGTVASALTAEQQEAVRQPADTRLLIIAAAGTGKTHTLVRRIEHLLEHDLVADEILVLSFSRAAVGELAARARASTGSSRFVVARTFDAWALDLLVHTRAAEDWHHRSFDERIAAAIEVVVSGQADEYTARVQHVLLDEVQDLEGDRRELVKSLLTWLDCGFTIVGDPAQAIYGFQVRDGGRPDDDGDMFTWARQTYSDDLVELALTRDFRARTPRPDGILRCGEALRTIGGSGSALAKQIRDEFAGSPGAGRLTDIVDGFPHFDGTTAILCRTNGQALDVSAELHRAGADHRLQRRAHDEVNPRWLVPLFRDHRGLSVDRDDFAEHTGLTGEPLDVVWPALLTVARTGSSRLDLGRLRTIVAGGRLPRAVCATDTAALTVSSMHRAKGLEYDRVFLLEDTVPEDSDEMEHARLLYMAMTRCRDDFFRLDPLPRSKVYAKTCRHSGRWGRYQFQFAGRRLGLALSGGDVSADRPAGTEGFTADPLELQDYLAREVRPGDPVMLTVLEQMPDDDLAVPAYAVTHGGRPIGVVSRGFRMDLARYMYRSAARLPEHASWPSAMTNCWIDDVEAVAGGAAQGRRVGLGEHGVWLAPRLTGLSSFRYHRNDTEHDDE
ncbi:hypothetical protein CS0771_32370 [Catellatospora sp. IY07-71]|uniref:UvrD-helicase domain-containing protein n=1 Tax=Catellatospora sp. IY07-71 TaxID=2728827 RepID=UPI001BB387F2|nr:UvrD-helicase domain-containing protein [Catellatospora sp. IY07-71]BCJ73693.1 hypothetical protein CS0771_32370 [Catellatospora sp. IY07-71]